jgi:hypothetical protein
MSRNLSYACPVCNGFASLLSHCPDCGVPLQDSGRLQDFLANYSPYRPIEEMKMTDGWIDRTTHRCPHQIYCSQCGYIGVTLIEEMPI